jgi:hypothetical protein
VVVIAHVVGPFTAAVRAVLDESMVERGALPGQGADHPVPASVLYCTPLDDLRRRWPELFDELDAAHGGGLRGSRGSCIDLVIEGSIDGGITTVKLEAVSIDHLAGGYTPLSGPSNLQDQLAAVLEWVERAMPTR